MITAAVVESVAHLDWTAIVVASIAAAAASFGAWQGRINAKAIRENSRLLKTNTGKTIGEHVESLQQELEMIASEKAEADARIAAAALVAAAKLALAVEPPPLRSQARETAEKLLVHAESVADRLSVDKKHVRHELDTGELDSDIRELLYLIKNRKEDSSVFDGVDRRVSSDPTYTGSERRKSPDPKP